MSFFWVPLVKGHKRMLSLNCFTSLFWARPVEGCRSTLNLICLTSFWARSVKGTPGKRTVEHLNHGNLATINTKYCIPLKTDVVVNYDKDPAGSSVQKLEQLLLAPESAQLAAFVAPSVRIIEEALDIYSPSSTCIAFNGGKDCTALLHLVHAVTKRYSKKKKNISNFIVISFHQDS